MPSPPRPPQRPDVSHWTPWTFVAVVGPLLVAALVTALVVGCSTDARLPSSIGSGFGDPEIGRHLIEVHGCGACHRIPGVPDADGLVGPPLDAMGRRTFIAGRLANTPDNMVRWVMHPHEVDPETAMPELGISRSEARNIVAYLEGLG